MSWLLLIRKEPITIHIYFITPQINTNLSPALPHTQFLSGKSCVSAAPSQHPVKIQQFSPLLTCCSVDGQQLTACDTEGICLGFGRIFFTKYECWGLTVSPLYKSLTSYFREVAPHQRMFDVRSLLPGSKDSPLVIRSLLLK